MDWILISSFRSKLDLMIVKPYTPENSTYRSKFSHAENRKFDAFMYLFFFMLVLLLAIYTSI